MSYSYTDPRPMKELTDAFLKGIADRLHLHSTVLLKLWLDDNRNQDGRPIGSGTFVSVGDTYGIVTAHHVAELLAEPFALGLGIAREGEEHAMRVERHSLQIEEVAIPEIEEYGPDLAFITLLDGNDVATVKASKLFHALDRDRDELLSRPPPDDAGVWFYCGTPEERTVAEDSEKGFLGLLTFQDLCLAGGPSVSCERGNYDYFDLDSDKDNEGPSSYSGMSGGGLWQVTISQSEEGSPTPGRYLFSGVSFYQGSRSDGTRFMRCHGRKSVYEHVFEAVAG